MMKINEVTTFKIPSDKTEADITMRELIDEGFEKDKSHPRQRLPILDAEGRVVNSMGNESKTPAPQK